MMILMGICMTKILKSTRRQKNESVEVVGSSGEGGSFVSLFLSLHVSLLLFLHACLSLLFSMSVSPSFSPCLLLSPFRPYLSLHPPLSLSVWMRVNLYRTPTTQQSPHTLATQRTASFTTFLLRCWRRQSISAQQPDPGPIPLWSWTLH